MSALMHVKPVAPRSRAPFALGAAVVAAVVVLAGCASRGTPPPEISLDEVRVAEAFALDEPATPIEVVAMPEPLPNTDLG